MVSKPNWGHSYFPHSWRSSYTRCLPMIANHHSFPPCQMCYNPYNSPFCQNRFSTIAVVDKHINDTPLRSIFGYSRWRVNYLIIIIVGVRWGSSNHMSGEHQVVTYERWGKKLGWEHTILYLLPWECDINHRQTYCGCKCWRTFYQVNNQIQNHVRYTYSTMCIALIIQCR